MRAGDWWQCICDSLLIVFGAIAFRRGHGFSKNCFHFNCCFRSLIRIVRLPAAGSNNRQRSIFFHHKIYSVTSFCSHKPSSVHHAGYRREHDGKQMTFYFIFQYLLALGLVCRVRLMKFNRNGTRLNIIVDPIEFHNNGRNGDESRNAHNANAQWKLPFLRSFVTHSSNMLCSDEQYGCASSNLRWCSINKCQSFVLREYRAIDRNGPVRCGPIRKASLTVNVLICGRRWWRRAINTSTSHEPIY